MLWNKIAELDAANKALEEVLVIVSILEESGNDHEEVGKEVQKMILSNRSEIEDNLMELGLSPGAGWIEMRGVVKG